MIGDSGWGKAFITGDEEGNGRSIYNMASFGGGDSGKPLPCDMGCGAGKPYTFGEETGHKAGDQVGKLYGMSEVSSE